MAGTLQSYGTLRRFRRGVFAFGEGSWLRLDIGALPCVSGCFTAPGPRLSTDHFQSIIGAADGGAGDQGTRLAVSFSPNWSEVVETAALIDQHLGPIVARPFEDRHLLCHHRAD